MLDLTTVCLFQKYMWISEEKDLDKCDVYLVMKKGGHFAAECPRRGYKGVVEILEQCRPMYITSDSMWDTTYADQEADVSFSENDMGIRNNYIHVIYYIYI